MPPTSSALQAGAEGVLRERLPRRPARPRPCAQAGQQLPGDDRSRPAIAEAVRRRRQERAVAATSCYEVISAGGVNSGIFQMMAGKTLEGDLTGLKFAHRQRAKDLRYYTHLAEIAAGAAASSARRCTRASCRPRNSASATSSSPRCSRRRRSSTSQDRSALSTRRPRASEDMNAQETTMNDRRQDNPAPARRRKLLKLSGAALGAAPACTASRRSSARGSTTTPGRRPRRRSRW